jgi:tetratricopeptide (TPR) repeat protein
MTRITAVGILEDFKRGVSTIKNAIKEFKHNHQMANQAISAIIDSLPPPFQQFCSVIWNGIATEDNAGEKILEILEKIEASNELSFMSITTKISELMEKNATKDEIQALAEQIRTSDESIINILGSKLDEIKCAILENKKGIEKNQNVLIEIAKSLGIQPTVETHHNIEVTEDDKNRINRLVEENEILKHELEKYQERAEVNINFALQLASYFYYIGNYDRSAKLLDQILEERPNTAPAWNSKGAILIKLGNYMESIKCFDNALEINPLFTEAWSNKGASLHQLKKYDEAIKCFDNALEINPKHAEAWSNRAFTLFELHKYDEAMESADKAISIRPNFGYAWNNKGMIFHTLKKYDEAIKCFDNALEINPKHAEAWYNKGLAFDDLQRYSEAVNYYDKAISINPKYVQAWDNKGTVFHQLGLSDEAIKCFDKALEINPSFGNAWYNKGVVLLDLKQYDESIKCFDKALEINSNDIEARNAKDKALQALRG